jgi:replication fork protection complex subunit Csm3/Swi3
MSKKLRLKGKGHEFSDVARLLNYYQQWLDNLYPRAKFADGLQLVEKVGHSKRMQVMRKEWIDEGKPGYIKKKSSADKDEFEDDDLYGSGEVNTTETRTDQRSEAAPNTSTDLDVADDSLFIADSNTNRNPSGDDDLPEDDELEALLAEQETRQEPPKAQATTNFDSEGEDDLDALLAEQDTRRASAPTSSRAGDQRSGPTTRVPEPFEDEEDDLDALLAEQETEIRSKPPTTQIQSPPARPAAPKRPSHPFEDDDDDDDDDDMDDLDALLAEQDARQTQQSISRPSAGPAMTMPQETERDNNVEASEAEIEAQMDIPADDHADDLDLLPTQGAGVAKAKEASQDADGEDFDAEGMFSSSPARQDE